jgi:hypothetical protein
MDTERMMIIDMLEAGRITVQEALRLLAALGDVFPEQPVITVEGETDCGCYAVTCALVYDGKVV